MNLGHRLHPLQSHKRCGLIPSAHTRRIGRKHIAYPQNQELRRLSPQIQRLAHKARPRRKRRPFLLPQSQLTLVFPSGFPSGFLPLLFFPGSALSLSAHFLIHLLNSGRLRPPLPEKNRGRNHPLERMRSASTTIYSRSAQESLERTPFAPTVGEGRRARKEGSASPIFQK